MCWKCLGQAMTLNVFLSTLPVADTYKEQLSPFPWVLANLYSWCDTQVLSSHTAPGIGFFIELVWSAAPSDYPLSFVFWSLSWKVS